MSVKHWHQLTIGLLIVDVGMSLTGAVSGSLRRHWHARRTYDTYVIGDGVVNSVTVTLDVRFGKGERRRILAEYGKVLSTYAPAFNPNSTLDVRPTP